MEKRLLLPDRVRQVPQHFSWVDHRLVSERFIHHCSPAALGLYLFLVTVGDAHGVSFYGDRKICEYLNLSAKLLADARENLQTADLIAYHKPLYQVLALPGRKAPRSASAGPHAIGAILAACLQEGTA